MTYRPNETMPSQDSYAAMVARITYNLDVTLLLEPGRFVVAAPEGDSLFARAKLPCCHAPWLHENND